MVLLYGKKQIENKIKQRTVRKNKSVIDIRYVKGRKIKWYRHVMWKENAKINMKTIIKRNPNEKRPRN